ncbi:hypothetical protein TNCV_3367941 [Trichonephila clavipes]|nr:hypothetical protein TNCV_3367941 [Trichonephila clavipes]
MLLSDMIGRMGLLCLSFKNAYRLRMKKKLDRWCSKLSEGRQNVQQADCRECLFIFANENNFPRVQSTVLEVEKSSQNECSKA